MRACVCLCGPLGECSELGSRAGREAETCSLTSGPQVLSGGPGSLAGQRAQGQPTHRLQRAHKVSSGPSGIQSPSHEVPFLPHSPASPPWDSGPNCWGPGSMTLPQPPAHAAFFSHVGVDDGGPQGSGVGRGPWQPWEGIQGTAMLGTGGGSQPGFRAQSCFGCGRQRAGSREGSCPRRRTKWEQPRRPGRGPQGTAGHRTAGWG